MLRRNSIAIVHFKGKLVYETDAIGVTRNSRNFGRGVYRLEKFLAFCDKITKSNSIVINSHKKS